MSQLEALAEKFCSRHGKAAARVVSIEEKAVDLVLK